jgi:hypothetical protein
MFGLVVDQPWGETSAKSGQKNDQNVRSAPADLHGYDKHDAFEPILFSNK